MNIGLIDVDSHNFPNLALMKISGWHKARGDNVEWWNGLQHYDRAYKSRVFDDTYSQDIEYCINADEVIRGGYRIRFNEPAAGRDRTLVSGLFTVQH